MLEHYEDSGDYNFQIHERKDGMHLYIALSIRDIEVCHDIFDTFEEAREYALKKCSELSGF